MDLRLLWQAQIWVILVPTVIYAIMFWGQSFPQPKAEASSPVANFKAMLNPLYLFMAACMALTAISEFGPQQWVGPILAKAGASPMLILALVTGLMAVGTRMTQICACQGRLASVMNFEISEPNTIPPGNHM